MSWGTIREGTKEEVVKALTEDFVGFAKAYPPGTLEGDDVAVMRARCFTLLDALDMSEDSYYGPAVRVAVSGSHSWSSNKETPRQANCKLGVTRVPKQS